MINDSATYQFAKESREEYMENRICTSVINLCDVIFTSEE